MKKGLVVVAVVVACAFGLTGAALATEVETGGKIQFKLTGTSEDGKASGLFGKGDVRIDYKVSLTSGPFEILLIPRFDLPSTLKWDKAYIKWSFDSLSLGMHPLGIDKELFDIEGKGGKPNIPKNAGIKFEIPVAPFGFDLAANNVAVGDEAKYSYGVGATYEINGVTLEGLFGTTDEAAADWYGSYYGGKVAVDLAPLTLEAQFGGFSPELEYLKDGSGYFAKFEYALDEELGTLTLKYTSVDKNLNGKGEPTDKAYSKIYGEYKYPLTEAVSLTLDAANIEPGTPAGAKSYTEYGVKIGVSL